MDVMLPYGGAEATKAHVLKRQNQTVEDFDNALYQLRREQFRLEADLSSAGLRLITLFQELELLRDMAKQDNALGAKLEKAAKEKASIDAQKVGVKDDAPTRRCGTVTPCSSSLRCCNVCRMSATKSWR
jgi:hypothetical protein